MSTSSRRANVIAGVLTAGLTTIITVIVFKLWQAHPRVPFLYSGDGLLTLSGLRNMRFADWYFTTPHLGFPVGQDLHDFPALGDNLHLAILWVLIRVFRDEVVAANFYFLASYPAVAVSAFAGLRLLNVDRQTSVVLGILYSFLPFHFLQGPGHLYLAAYWSVPIAAAFLIRQLQGTPIGHSPTSLRVRDLLHWLRSPGTIATVAAGIITASTGFYFGFFLFVLAVLAALTHTLNKDERHLIAPAVLLGISSAATLGAQFLPIWLYQRANGSNLSMVARSLAATEFYSLKLVDLILPMPGHRIHSFSALRDKASAVYLIGENSMALGVIASVGLLLLLVQPLRRGFRPTPNRRGLILFVCLAIAVAMVGGIGQFVATLGFTQIRVWSRISVFIGFGALAYFGTILDSRTLVIRSRLFARALVSILLLVGLFDTTRPSMLPDFRTSARAWELDTYLVKGIEAAISPEAKILQLPFVPFPENPPVVGMEDYDHLRGYLHSPTLFWSYGAIKGRGVEIHSGLDPAQPNFAIQFRKLQFDAVWLNRRGYEDGGKEASSRLLASGFDLILDVNDVAIFRHP